MHNIIFTLTRYALCQPSDDEGAEVVCYIYVYCWALLPRMIRCVGVKEIVPSSFANVYMQSCKQY